MRPEHALVLEQGRGIMNEIQFEWDEAKNKENQRRHGISFEEAQPVFYDRCARLMADPDHSEVEDRFVLMGLDMKLRLLVVCHCYRAGNRVIRIISARKGTRQEARHYRR